jgi:hypothetical protein
MIALTKPLTILFGRIQIIRAFIWLGGIKLLDRKKLGGLGIRTARETNICLLGHGSIFKEIMG